MNATAGSAEPSAPTIGRCPFAGHAATTTACDANPRPVAQPWADQPILDAIDRWASQSEPDGLDLARMIAAHVRAIGKHFLSVLILARLAEIRRHHARQDPFFDAFLDCILDKYEGRYYNRSYIALSLLEAIADDPAAGLNPDRLSALLMADVIRFEAAAAEHGVDDRPDALTRRKRISHALRFVADCKSAPDDNGPESLPSGPAGIAGEWFDLMVLPAYVAHDEYFFIRALQAHEVVYAVLASEMGAATRALREGSADEAVARLDRVNDVFARAAMLFRLVATMRPEQFHAFREYTQGASAIQSESYKRFEVACGRPTDERLASDAFTNVPAVQADALGTQDDFSQAYLDARLGGTFDPNEWDAIDDRLSRLEASHQRWKITHHSLAARMLGEATGSGYTSGVPYLKRCISNRLFWRLGESHLSGSQAG
jgi:tryptophan 2,3-dioxygenase